MRRKKILWLLPLAVLLTVLGWEVRHGNLAEAIFNSEEAVHIKAEEIENATLLIGTHLIYLQSLNDELYQIAMESAFLSGQNQKYYKSELAGGSWFDITEASSLSDITEAGIRTESGVIEELLITHHTKSDGITYDLRNNQAVCIYDIYPVYELEQMQELEPLKLNYDLMKESGEQSDLDKKNISLVQDFFATETRTDQTNQYDAMMAALQGYYVQLSENQAPLAETEVVLQVMGKLDAARKTEVYTRIDTVLEALMTELMEGENDSLLTACGNSQSNISESMVESQGNVLSEGTTEMTAMEYALANDMITKSLQNLYAECDTDVTSLLHLYHIMDGQIISAQEELAVLEQLIAGAEAGYAQGLGSGETAEYIQARESGASHALLENLQKEAAGQVDIIRNELQFYVQAKVERLEAGNAREYILKTIENTADFSKKVKADDFQGKLEQGIREYVAWLQGLLEGLKDQSAGNMELSQLYEQKESLLEERLNALDQNHLDLAKQLEEKIASLDKKIQKEEKKTTDALAEAEQERASLEGQKNRELQIAGLDARIAELSGQLSSQTEARNILEQKSKALSYIRAGDTSEGALSGISQQIEGIAVFVEHGSYLALAAVKSLYQEMTAAMYLQDATEYGELLNRMEEIVTESDVADLGNEISGEEAMAVLEEQFADIPLTEFLNASENSTSEKKELSPKEASDLSIALIALGAYAEEEGNEQIGRAAAGMAGRLANQYPNQGQVFLAHSNAYGAFAPADLTARYLKYRYIWNDTKKVAILADGSSYYEFTSFHQKVLRGNGTADTMKAAAEFDGMLYIPEDYLEAEFGLVICPVAGTDYYVLVTLEEMEESRKLLEILSESGE